MAAGRRTRCSTCAPASWRTPFRSSASRSATTAFPSRCSGASSTGRFRATSETFACIRPCRDLPIPWNTRICLFTVVSSSSKPDASTKSCKSVSPTAPPRPPPPLSRSPFYRLRLRLRLVVVVVVVAVVVVGGVDRFLEPPNGSTLVRRPVAAAVFSFSSSVPPKFFFFSLFGHFFFHFSLRPQRLAGFTFWSEDFGFFVCVCVCVVVLFSPHQE